MKINSITPAEFLKPASYPNNVKPVDADSRINSTDEVKVSPEAITFSKAMNAAKASLAVDTDKEKIAEVKEQVDAGTYFVSADKIAESIIMGQTK